MNLMADECIDRHIVARLREEGHEVLYVAEMDLAFQTKQYWKEQIKITHYC